MKKFVVLLAALAMVGLFTTAAIADVSLYGSARFRTYYQDVDPNTTADSDSDLEWRIGHLTRFGAKFTSGDVGGHFELDARAGSQGSTGNIEADSGASGLGNMRLRHNYGWWNFGSGKLLVGQTFPLYDAPVSGINYHSGGVQKYGGIGYDVARTSQIRLTFGDFAVAFLSPDTSKTIPSGLPTTTGLDVNTTLPKIELRYDLKAGPAALSFIGGYQSYEVEALTGGPYTGSEDIDSYVLGFTGQMNFGAAYVNLALTYRQNGNNYGAWTGLGASESPVFEGTELKDATCFGGVLVVGFKASDTITLEATYSMLDSEQDTTLTNEDELSSYGVMCKITMAPGVYIIPEIIVVDNDTKTVNGVESDESELTAFGVFWRIDYK